MIGKGRQDSAKFSNWRPKATELERFASCAVEEGQSSWARRACARSHARVAKSSNPRPQGQRITIWLGLWTRVRRRVPPRPRRSSNRSARTRRNPHQPARLDAKPLIFNKPLDRSALADCGLSMW